MSRRNEELAARIRDRRPHVRAAVAGLVSADELARRVRRHPGRWIAFGVVAGAIAGRFFGRPLAREGRRRIVAVASGRLQQLGLGLVTALLANARQRPPAAPLERPADARPTPRVAARSTVR